VAEKGLAASIHLGQARQVPASCKMLRNGLGPFGYQWLCACAVFPGLRLPLTLALGNALADAAARPRPDEVEIRALCDLTWFRRGWIPDEFRLQLIGDIAPNFRQIVGQVIDVFVQEILAPLSGGSAEAIRRPRGTGKLWRDFMNSLIARGQIRGVAYDYLFLTYMNGGQPKKLQVAVPPGGRENGTFIEFLLERGTMRRLRLTLLLSSVLLVAALEIPSVVRAWPKIAEELSKVWQDLEQNLSGSSTPSNTPKNPVQPKPPAPGGQSALVADATNGKRPPAATTPSTAGTSDANGAANSSPPPASDGASTDQNTQAGDGPTSPSATGGTGGSSSPTGEQTTTDNGGTQAADTGAQTQNGGATAGPSAGTGDSTQAQGTTEPLPPAVRTFIIFFDFDSTTVTEMAQEVLAEVVKSNQGRHCLVTGHTDTAARSAAYALDLTEREAQSAAEVMRNLGFTGSLSTQGKGYNDPLVPTGPGVREPQNRRVVIDCS